MKIELSGIVTIIFFIGALFWFLAFAADYTYNKDFTTWMCLLGSVTWWTCGLLNFIKNNKHK